MEWWGYLLATAGAVATLSAGVAGIKSLVKPVTDIAKRVERLERHNVEDMKRFDCIDERFRAMESNNQVILISLHAILSHLRDDNSTGEMDKALNVLVKHIIED